MIDNKTVITGSLNWSPSAGHTNDETLLIIESPQLTKHFTREMDRLWRGAELGVTPRMQRTLQQRREQCGSGPRGSELAWELASLTHSGPPLTLALGSQPNRR